ncbi:hypothetical protein BV25DRAFT_1308309 [Artomyces pyxidatus]|uniref:Uncharacterized protein n=1 Tax=Artomyces pyxidatus TaxID=48021 RepID=A0ACB8SPS5_9AGAM|nr:hypothetical protein BV25DRAFT_1308309 [Artomyces pyxidatus]
MSSGLSYGKDFSKLQEITYSFAEREKWSPGRWKESFGHARLITTVTTTGSTGPSLTDALSALHPDELFSFVGQGDDYDARKQVGRTVAGVKGCFTSALRAVRKEHPPLRARRRA